MPNPNDLTQKALQALRRQGSVLTSAELQASLGVGQPVPFARMVPLEGCAF